MMARDRWRRDLDRWRRKLPTAKRSAGQPSRWRVWLVAVGSAATAAGAGVMYLFDPQQGRRRRHLAVDRTRAAIRHTGRRAGRWGRRLSAETYGTVQRVRHRWDRAEPAANDETLADRVKSEIFRDPTVPQGRVNLNVEDGVVVLRGQLDRPEQIRDLTEAARKVPGVRDVESYLHLPGTVPPNKQDAMSAEF